MFWVSNLFFFIKENWICAMSRHHADSNINILLKRNLSVDGSNRQRGHSLMIPLSFLWTKSNNRTHGQFKCDVTWFCFCFDFLFPHARWVVVSYFVGEGDEGL